MREETRETSIGESRRVGIRVRRWILFGWFVMRAGKEGFVWGVGGEACDDWLVGLFGVRPVTKVHPRSHDFGYGGGVRHINIVSRKSRVP